MDLTTPAGSSVDDERIIDRTFYDTIEIYILSICFIVGAPLNLISFYKLITKFYSSRRRKSKRRSSIGGAQINFLRIHLNIADLLILFAYTLPQICWLFTTQWYGGNILCKVIKFFYAFVFYLTSFIIVCIAIDRVYGAYSLSLFEAPERAFKRCQNFIIIAYIFAFLLSLPQLYIFSVVSPFDVPDFQQCAPIWMTMKFELQVRAASPEITNEEQHLLWIEHVKITKWDTAYNICHLLFVFWIPAFIIIVSYVYILWILNGFLKSGKHCLNMNSLKKLNICTKANKSPQHQKPAKAFTQTSYDDDNVSAYGISDPANPQKTILLELNQTPRPSFVEEIKTSAISSARCSEDFRVPPTRCDARLGLMALHTIAIAKQKTKRQATFIVIAYLTLWTPYNLFAIINIFIPQESRLAILNNMMEFTPFLNSLIVVNAIVNPLIYGIFDKAYE